MSDCPLICNQNILVVVAHPDDAESFCGGTIARIVQRSNRATVEICTNGDRGSHDRQIRPSELVNLRQIEQDRARKILGIKEVIWLGYRDGELAQVNDLRERIIRIIRQQQSTVIITFDPWKHYEFHPDHRVVGFVTGEARMLADLPWICPEFTLEGLVPWHVPELYLFSAQEPNHWVDITPTIELKVKSRLAHRSQNDFIQSEEDRQAFIREIKPKAEEARKECRNSYAEAFYKVDQTEFWI
jgi:N,N'-diacetylchitobiose non-reducing end deacetylase